MGQGWLPHEHREAAPGPQAPSSSTQALLPGAGQGSHPRQEQGLQATPRRGGRPGRAGSQLASIYRALPTCPLFTARQAAPGPTPTAPRSRLLSTPALPLFLPAPSCTRVDTHGNSNLARQRSVPCHWAPQLVPRGWGVPSLRRPVPPGLSLPQPLVSSPRLLRSHSRS